MLCFFSLFLCFFLCKFWCFVHISLSHSFCNKVILKSYMWILSLLLWCMEVSNNLGTCDVPKHPNPLLNLGKFPYSVLNWIPVPVYIWLTTGEGRTCLCSVYGPLFLLPLSFVSFLSTCCNFQICRRILLSNCKLWIVNYQMMIT